MSSLSSDGNCYAEQSVAGLDFSAAEAQITMDTCLNTFGH